VSARVASNTEFEDTAPTPDWWEQDHGLSEGYEDQFRSAHPAGDANSDHVKAAKAAVQPEMAVDTTHSKTLGLSTNVTQATIRATCQDAPRRAPPTEDFMPFYRPAAADSGTSGLW
jgi:hypothetical protein